MRSPPVRASGDSQPSEWWRCRRLLGRPLRPHEVHSRCVGAAALRGPGSASVHFHRVLAVAINDSPDLAARRRTGSSARTERVRVERALTQVAERLKHCPRDPPSLMHGATLPRPPRLGALKAVTVSHVGRLWTGKGTACTRDHVPSRGHRSCLGYLMALWWLQVEGPGGCQCHCHATIW